MKHLILSIILSFASVNAVANDVAQEAMINSVSAPEDAFADEPSVEALMMKKIEVVEKAEKISQIESIINMPEDNVIKTNPEEERVRYRPLKDSSPKQLQSAPPFRISN